MINIITRYKINEPMHRQRPEHLRQPRRSMKDHNDSFVPTYHSSHEESNCQNCALYEEDISILQQKLMETHNKLIEQIDLCREQEIKMIQLMKDRGQNQQNMRNHSNMREKQHSQKQAGRINRKNEEEYKHSMEPLIQTKNQLLRNDLEAMRSKVLSEIVKSNKLQEKMRQLQQNHEQEIIQFRERIRKLEASRNNLVDTNEKLHEEKAILVKQLKNKQEEAAQCICGFEEKYYELDKAFMSQRAVMNQLIDQNNLLENQLHELKIRAHRARQEVYTAKAQQIRTQPKKRKPINKQKGKQEFEQTKNLIKKLQLAEKQIRVRGHNDRL